MKEPRSVIAKTFVVDKEPATVPRLFSDCEKLGIWRGSNEHQQSEWRLVEYRISFWECED